jgi:hypothetical protein
MSVPNKTYRVYCFDGAHAIVTADWLDAASDEEAIAKAKARGFGTKCEIWERSRLVASLGERPAKGGAGDLSGPPCAQCA